jgi:hypothetical protein
VSCGVLPRAALVVACLIVVAAPLGADQYKVLVKRIDANVFQAQASKVIIETRHCGNWLPDNDGAQEAILNWEGTFGHNWIRFTASRTRCDVASIRQPAPESAASGEPRRPAPPEPPRGPLSHRRSWGRPSDLHPPTGGRPR